MPYPCLSVILFKGSRLGSFFGVGALEQYDRQAQGRSDAISLLQPHQQADPEDDVLTARSISKRDRRGPGDQKHAQRELCWPSRTVPGVALCLPRQGIWEHA